MNKIKVGLVSLGCDKNRIDSEIILSKLDERYTITNDPKNAEVIIVNTCGFIDAAKEESINTILQMSKYKKNYNCKVLVATGCLTQRYNNELEELLPEVDIILGVNNYDKLIESIDKVLNNKEKICLCTYSNININEGNRILTTSSHYAYIRIAEGCNNFCSYCIIPKIRGVYRSRTMESILTEARSLVSQGVKELILVAQDSTKYGTDLYKEKYLHILIRELSNIEQLEWIRILYCYPEEIYEDLVNEISTNKKVCKYLDLPIQHISNSILKNMRRKTDKESIYNIINSLRNKINNICLRTSIIVGFPGETEEDFNELKEFISWAKFDKLGVFKFSSEEGTKAYEMDNQIDDKIKQSREKELMMLQKDISKTSNKLKIGNTYKVIVEGYNNEMYYGRSYEMCPEIDGYVYFKTNNTLKKGEFVNVKVTNSLEYDLIGVVCYESCQ